MSCRTAKIRWHSSLAMGLAVLAACLPASLVRAQACALSPNPVFAGHNLPLDIDPNPQAMRLTAAFPALSFGPLVGLYAPPDGSDRLFAVEQGVQHGRERVHKWCPVRSLYRSGEHRRLRMGLPGRLWRTALDRIFGATPTLRVDFSFKKQISASVAGAVGLHLHTTC